MSKKSFIDSVRVDTPCGENWEKMHGNERVRFCGHCAKDVKNLSAVTRKQAMRIVRASDGGICIRYRTNKMTNRPMFANQLFQITRRSPGLTASVMAASLGLSSMTFAQTGPAHASPVAEIVRGNAKKPTNNPAASISGTISDPNKAVIPSATVNLFALDANRSVTTDGDGRYIFENLTPGNYRIESDATGFKTGGQNVTVSGPGQTSADISLGIEIVVSVDVINEYEAYSMGMGGAMASIEYSSPLTRAVADDDIELVRELIARGEKIDGTDENYDEITPLFIAVENGNVEIARLLIDFGAKINARDRQKQTPLMRVDEDATPRLIDLLVNAGADVNVTDDDGNTALIFAADNANYEVLKKLIQAGAEINTINKEGDTALMKAAYNDNIDSVRILLESGAKVNLVNNEGETAYDMATVDEVQTLLMAFGAKIKTAKSSN